MENDYSSLAKLEGRTYSLEYSPNCPSNFLIRLIHPGNGTLKFDRVKSDLILFEIPGRKPLMINGDIRGYGKTIQDAVNNALSAYKKAKRVYQKRLKKRVENKKEKTLVN